MLPAVSHVDSSVPIYAAARPVHPAGAHADAGGGAVHHPHPARQHDRGARERVRDDGAPQGAARAARAQPPRAAQRAGPGAPGHGAQPRLAGRRRRRGRVPLRLPRHRLAARRLRRQPRHAHGAGDLPDHRRASTCSPTSPPTSSRSSSAHDSGRACDEYPRDQSQRLRARRAAGRPRRPPALRVAHDAARGVAHGAHQDRRRHLRGHRPDRRRRPLGGARTRRRSSWRRRSRRRTSPRCGWAATTSATTCSRACSTAAAPSSCSPSRPPSSASSSA